MPKPYKSTYSILRELLASVNGATFIGLDTITEVKLKGGKKNPFYGRVQKLQIGASVMVFQNKRQNGYENMVGRRLVAEQKDPSSFHLSPRSWGERLPECPFVMHLNSDGELNYYLEVIFLHAGAIEYRLDGNVVNKEILQGLEEDHEEAAQGGLRNKVILRCYSCDSIFGITVNKEYYRLREVL